MADAQLVLEDGTIFHGSPYGAVGECVGEAVFCTAMTGYQETLTDPSYHRQVVVMTAPHIGNTGVNDEDVESSRIWVAGFVVRDPARRVSSHRAKRSLDDELRSSGVVGISGVDTRAITRHLRERGAMRVGIFSGDVAGRSEAELLDVVRSAPSMSGADLAGEVTTDRPYIVPALGEKRFTVAAVDLGIKGMTPRLLAQRGVEVHVLTATSTIEDVLAVEPDGVFFSNGPGDPGATDGPITLLREVLERGIPFFGICFGNQLLGRALGLSTYKLRFGHRGINQPVLDRSTGRVEVTAHNHGFAVRAPGQADGEVAPEGPFETDFGRAEVSHVCLNDGVVEGLHCLDVPAFSVQYHPEAAAGPHDAGYLFDRFTDLMASAPTSRDHGIAPPSEVAGLHDHAQGVAGLHDHAQGVAGLHDHHQGGSEHAQRDSDHAQGVAGLHDHAEGGCGHAHDTRDHGIAPPSELAGLHDHHQGGSEHAQRDSDHAEGRCGYAPDTRDHAIAPPSEVAGLHDHAQGVVGLHDHAQGVAGSHDHEEGGMR